MNEITNIAVDCPGDKQSHGYTQTNKNTYYWVWDGELTFRKLENDEIPPAVKVETKQWCEINSPFV